MSRVTISWEGTTANSIIRIIMYFEKAKLNWNVNYVLSLVIVILVNLIPSISLSQSPFKLSEKHLAKVNRQENSTKKINLYRKYFKKDSIKYAKQQDIYWQTKTDSLAEEVKQRSKALESRGKKSKDGINSKVYRTVYKPWAEKNARKQVEWLIGQGIIVSSATRAMLFNFFCEYFLQASQNDSLLAVLKQQQPNLTLPRSLSTNLSNYNILHKRQPEFTIKEVSTLEHVPAGSALKNNASPYFKEMKQYSAYSSQLPDYDSLQGFATLEASRLATDYAGKKIDGFDQVSNTEKSLNAFRPVQDQYGIQVEQLKDSAYLKEQAKKKAEELAMKHISEHPEIMKSVQQRMALLMKKYSVVPNAKDLSTAVKRTSLKGKSFKERLYVAGNLQVVSVNPVSLDFSPMLGYRITRDLVAGIGGNYRQSFADTIPTFSPTVFGYKAFASYDLVKNFFAYAEFDRNSPGLKHTETSRQRIWKNAAFLGLGRKFMISPKVEMTIVMMYNFLHEHPDPIYPKPWNIKIGFQTSELAFFKAKPTFK
jgi:hypothetical protein